MRSCLEWRCGSWERYGLINRDAGNFCGGHRPGALPEKLSERYYNLADRLGLRHPWCQEAGLILGTLLAGMSYGK
jgi:hypothetical protein